MLLAIETSTRTGSVALMTSLYIVKEAQLGGDRNHAEALASSVKEVTDGDLSKVERYAFSVGPGSFTGLRIGLAFLKGLAAVHPKPVMPVSSLLVMAHEIHDHDRGPGTTHILVMLDARRDEVFAVLYDRNLKETDILPEGVYGVAEVLARLDFAGIVAGGDGTALSAFKDAPWRVADPTTWGPKAFRLGQIAEYRFNAGEGVDPMTVEPVYYQRSAAEVNLGITAPIA